LRWRGGDKSSVSLSTLSTITQRPAHGHYDRKSVNGGLTWLIHIGTIGILDGVGSCGLVFSS
jgi:hypothetical protein